MKERMKNLWFWVGLVGVALTAMGVSPETFTSWDAVWTALIDLFQNPFLLVTTVLAILGVFVEPTTPGITDGSASDEM